jgi:uncharacterized phage protein (TIGR01671 family)
MRELKFRAWNKELGEMWIGGYVQFDTGNIWFDNEDGDMFEYTQAEFPLMQYTGLKDKNGKEIYEGDILNDKRNKRRKYKVVFDDGTLFCVSLSDGILPEGFNMHRLTKQNVQRLHEVIGNIYENPELLGAKG